MNTYTKIVLAFILGLCTMSASADLDLHQESAVVEVTDQYKRMGTAFAISKDRLATAYHVVKNEPVIFITYRGQRVRCYTLAFSEYYDFAILSAPGLNVPDPLKIAETTRVGDSVVIYGFPERAYFSRTYGTVTTLSTDLMNEFFTRPAGKANAKVRPGYSGGPVVNRHTNEVVGILTNHEMPNPMELIRGTRDFDGIFTRSDQVRSLWRGASSRR